MQNGMIPQGGPGAGMPAVGQSPFPQQMNRQMQASPMPGQQQMPMNMNDPNQQVPMQPRQPSQQAPQPQPQQPQAMLQQQQPPQQRPQQRSNGGPSLTDDLNSLTPQEYDHVCRIADQILSKTSQEDVEKIRLNLQNMTPEQKTYLLRKNIDPVTYFFRSQALTQLKRHKRARLELSRAQNAGVDPAAMMNDPMMNPQQRQLMQNMMNLQRNSGFPMANNQQHLDPSSFIGNVENIQGQQADGLRSQEAGQLVVPASSSQMNQQPFNPQNMFQVGQQMGQGGQANMNGAGMNPQQFFSQQQIPNSQSVQPDRTQQATQFPPQTQAQTQAQARAQAAQKAQIAISQAGQANPHMQQQMSQQNSAMPMLNRPMAPGQISPAQVAAQVRPPSRAPANGVQPMAGQPAMQGRPQLPAGLPQPLHDHLSQMNPEQLNNFINQQRRAQAMARGGGAQPSMPMQQNMSQPGQSGQNQQMANGQMGNNQNMRASFSLQQQLAGMGGAQPQPNQMMQGQQMSVQQRQQQQQRQQEYYKLQLLRQQSGALEMTPDQAKEMDRLPFPPSILSNNPNMVSPVPKHIKTWGQLKQWAAANQQVLGGMDLQKLMTMQKFHLAQLMAHGKENGRNPEQGGQGSWMPVPFQGQQQPFGNPQPHPANQQQSAANMPPIRPVTAQDIQLARQRLGTQVQGFNDEQLRELLQRNRQKQWIQLAQQRATIGNPPGQQGQPGQQVQQVQQGQQTHPAQQPPVAAPMNTTPQIKQEPQAQQVTSQPAQPAQPIKAPTAASGKGAKGPVAKPPPKRKMQQEELTDSQNHMAQASTQPAATQGAPASTPARPNMPLTREQLAAMTPQQRLQLEAHIRRQQGGQARPPISKAAAEEAWNNLPEKIRQLYNDMAKQAPPAEPVAITPEQKAAMTHQLRECIDMLGRMEALVQWFAKVPGQEKNVRSLLVMVRPLLNMAPSLLFAKLYH